MNSVYYHHYSFWIHLKRIAKNNPSMDPVVAEKILNFKNYDKEQDALFWISRILNGLSSVDRTGKLNNFKTSYETIPDVGDFNKSFETVCLETATNLWKSNNIIEVLWSGGIDSTTAALALLETKPFDKKLIIGGTMNSIIEYPKFYETHKDICQLTSNKNFFSLERLNSDHLVVTGAVADQLWGFNIGSALKEDTYKKDAPWQYMFDWEDPFKQNRINRPDSHPSKQPWSRTQKDKFIKILEEHAQSCPFKIETYFDMGWWINFSTKFNYDKSTVQAMSAYIHQPECINLNNFVPFYQTDDFQRWALTSHAERRASAGGSMYKQNAKEFIFSVNKDYDYLKNKRKEASVIKAVGKDWWKNYYSDPNANYAIMSNGDIYSNKRDMPINIIESIIGKT
jgi:hypothetical protein